MTTQFTFRDTVFYLDTRGTLTEKEEVEAINLLLGLTYKESARIRGVSPETAKRQRAVAKSKVEARSQYEFVMACVASGWLTPLDAVFSLGRRISAVLTVPATNFIDQQFHQAQACNQTRESVDGARGQKSVVAPLFLTPAPGSDWFYDIPTAQRRKIERMVNNFQHRDAERMQAYVEKATKRFYEEVA